ncbi:PREDICTED: low affinity immunoglobulin gamma Fc region receptor II-like [Bison bison bison]|uniref:low affinity immunoglobulin gamma Fc region receptor II-like n=1 Tax=Bison bison bison TaxID=43346 RepID=UPI0005775058|nr:PREDICTED: low affinity immunoglobulin gamma Fc region receptor II-like [Bison bison bison]
MGIPSFLAFPAARRNRAHCTPWHPWGHMLLWTALLFLAPVPGKCGKYSTTSPLSPSSLCSLHPVWRNSGGTSNPRLSFRAGSNDSGSYRCQREQTSLSDPVHLDVISDWLLLQTPSLVFQEGEPIMLRCHSWRNQPLNKITFYQDGKSKIFSYQRTNFSIPLANLSHSGQYHCTAFIGKMLHSSQPVNITVQDGNEGPAVPLIFSPWYQITFCLVMGLLLAVDTGLYFSVQRDLQSSMGDGKNNKVRWSQDHQDK